MAEQTETPLDPAIATLKALVAADKDVIAFGTPYAGGEGFLPTVAVAYDRHIVWELADVDAHFAVHTAVLQAEGHATYVRGDYDLTEAQARERVLLR
jgi:hypothetical protein